MYENNSVSPRHSQPRTEGKFKYLGNEDHWDEFDDFEFNNGFNDNIKETIEVERVRQVRKTETTEENFLFRTTLHWKLFVKPFILFSVLTLVLCYFAFVTGLPLPALTFSVIAFLVFLLPPWIKYATSKFIITTQRVIVQFGWLDINSSGLFLNKIEGVRLYQSYVERRFNFGTLLITGTGGAELVLHSIVNPAEFSRQLHVAVHSQRTLSVNNFIAEIKVHKMPDNQNLDPAKGTRLRAGGNETPFFRQLNSNSR